MNPVRLEREGILVLVGEPLGDALLIPVAALGRTVITGSDGSEWAPVGASEGVNVRLLSDTEHPYLSGVTYEVSLHIEYAFAPGAGPTMVFQFTVR